MLADRIRIVQKNLEWWAQVLANEAKQRNPDEFQVSDSAGAGVSLYFMKVPEGKSQVQLPTYTQVSEVLEGPSKS